MKLLLASGLLTLSLASPFNADANSAHYREHALIDICQAVKSDSVMQLKRTIKGHHLSLQTVKDKLVCNQLSAFDFAVSVEAYHTAGLVAPGHVDIRDLTALKNSKQSAPIGK